MKRLALILGVVAMTGCASFHAEPLPNPPKESTFATVGDTHVHYKDEGQGAPVVLLHGFASSLGAWTDLAPELVNQGRRAVRLDLKGFGWTNRPEGDYSPAFQAQMTWQLLDQLGIQKTDLVAHSWGSSVALEMALQQPERVRRIVLYDAWVYEEQLPSFFVWSRASGVGEALFAMFYKERPDEKMARAFYDPDRYVSEAFVEKVEAQLDRPGTTAAALAAVRGQDYATVQTRYSEITQPTLLLWGREDAVTLMSFGERLANDLKDARLIVYPRCGHFPMIEAKDASTRDLLAFLEDTSEFHTPPTNAVAPVETPLPAAEPPKAIDAEVVE